VKRSDALRSLSRDHHEALVVALRLRRATAETAIEARARFLAFWTAHGELHFRLEETTLLPAYAAHGDPYHPLVLGVLGDHVAIRQRAAGLAADPDAPLEALHELGQRLDDHVRREERELFPLIEEAMPEDELAALAAALSRAEAEAAAAAAGR
jgi:hemerythrin-like domain-containing protein